MSSLPYIRVAIGSSTTFYLILLILPNCAVGLTLEYVPNLALATRKNNAIANSEELIQEEKGAQQDTEVNQSMGATDISTNVGHEGNAKFDNDLKKNVGMLVRITPRMINYWAMGLKQMFQKELENKELPEFSRILMKLNVSILTPRIRNVKLPKFSYKVQYNNTMEIILHGGSAQLSSSYRAVYRTIREGHLEANMSNFLINLKLKIATTFAGKLLLEDIICGTEVRSIDIKLTPKLHELVDQGLRIELDETVSVVICEALEAFTNKFEERLNKLIRSPVVEIKKSPNDKMEMIYLYISESVLNIFLKQLATFGDTALQLHTNPEFQKMLSLNCSEDEKCMGDLLQDTELYVPDSGQMIIKIRSPLVSSVRNGFALIDLHLTSFVTYKQEDMDVKVLEFEWLATIHVSNEYLNEHLAERVQINQLF
uniref:BPI1 domain-containing protein n=1 Tax=Loa loa TaxID=7209 RepID=A0A1I7VLR0_LOALO